MLLQRSNVPGFRPRETTVRPPPCDLAAARMAHQGDPDGRAIYDPEQSSAGARRQERPQFRYSPTTPSAPALPDIPCLCAARRVPGPEHAAPRSPISAPRSFGRSNTPLDLGTTMAEAGVDTQSPLRVLIPEAAQGNEALESFEAPPMARHPANMRPTSAPAEASNTSAPHPPLYDLNGGAAVRGNALPARRIPARVASARRGRPTSAPAQHLGPLGSPASAMRPATAGVRRRRPKSSARSRSRGGAPRESEELLPSSGGIRFLRSSAARDDDPRLRAAVPFDPTWAQSQWREGPGEESGSLARAARPGSAVSLASRTSRASSRRSGSGPVRETWGNVRDRGGRGTWDGRAPRGAPVLAPPRKITNPLATKGSDMREVRSGPTARAPRPCHGRICAERAWQRGAGAASGRARRALCEWRVGGVLHCRSPPVQPPISTG
jgi:hypothetical protein